MKCINQHKLKYLLFIWSLLFADVTAQFNISSVMVENESCAGANDGKITITVSGGAAPYDYYVFGPSNAQILGSMLSTVTFSGLSAGGGYTLFVLDNNGNFDDESTSIMPGISVPAPVASSNSPICVGQTLNLTASTIPGAGYEWIGPNSFTSNLQNPSISNAQHMNAGLYKVRASLPGGQSKTCYSNFSNTNVIVTEQPVASFNINKNVLCENENAIITYTGTIVPGATYNWNFDGATVLSGAGSGPYIIRWSTSGTKSISLSVNVGTCVSNTFIENVLVNPLPTAFLSGSTTICSGSSATLRVDFTGTGPWVFSYTNGFDVIQETATTNPYFFTVSPTVTTNYSLTVPFKDANCQSAIYGGTATVVVKSTPTASISGSTTVCEGDSATLYVSFTGTAPFSFTYTDGVNTFSDISNSPFKAIRVKPNSPITNYTLVSMNDADGCIGSVFGLAVVNVKTNPTSDFDLPSVSCVGTIVNVNYTGNASGSASFVWNFDSPSSAVPGTGQGPHQVIWGTIGTKTVSLFVIENGCVSTITTKNIVIENKPQAGIFALNPNICSGQTALIRFQFSGNGPYNFSYSISNKLGNTVVNQTTNTPNLIVPFVLTDTTTYTLLSISNNVCLGDIFPVSAVVNVKPNPTSTFDLPSSACLGNLVTVTYSGNAKTSATFNWNFDGGVINSGSGIGPYDITWHSSGTRTVTLQVTQDGCTSPTTSKNIEIYDLPVVSIDPIPNQCLNSTPVNLSAIPAGGTFSGPGVVGNQFDPNSAGVGNHSINYTYQDNNGCIASATTFVTVNDLPLLVFNNPGTSFCINSPTITLTATPAGGVFSGNGVLGNQFTPNAAGIGNHVLSYTYTDLNGCTNTANRTVSVYPLPMVSIDNTVTGLCFNASPINLTGVPAGGTFTGNGVIGNTFDPAAAGIGVHTINYSYTDGNGCSNFTTLDITVYALPLVTINASSTSVCLNDSPVTLNGTPEGGTFHGNGVIGNLFNPVLAGVGMHTITYQYADENGCENSSSLNIEVKPLPYVDLQASQNEVCVSGPIVTLTGNPIGGIYLGNGVSGNQFNPTVAGVGTHLISYTYTGTNGCSNTTNINIIVHPLPSPMITSLPGPYCVNSPIVNLTANPTGGIFSGTGVSGNTFNPSAAGVGTHTISYSYTDNNNCSNTVNQDVTVLALPTVTLTASQNSICLNGGIISLSGLPNGGIYSGNGVVGNQFDPSLAGVGVHLVTYQYTDGNGCESTSSINIEVKPLPNVSFIFVPSAMCFNDPNVTLVASPSGGVFTGAGISGNQFDPGAAGIGNHTILYKYTANNGCSDSVTAQITVHPNPTATLSGGGIFCEGDEATLTFNLSGTSAWTVSYTDGNVLYTETLNNSPSSINVNLFSSVTYTIVNVSDQNCSSGNVNGSAVFVVNPLPSLTIVPVTPQCLNNPPVLLNAMPLGGTFSGNGVVGNSFFPNIAGIGNHVISYTYTDGNNCTNSTTTSVEVTDVPNANFVSPVSACVGEEVSLNYIGNASPNAIYTWNFDGGVLTGGTNQNPIVKWNGSGIKTIRLKVLENGCESSEESQTIQLLSLPLASISGNQDICLGDNATLNFNATGVAPFTLIYTNGINQFVVNTNSANTSVQVSPVDTTTYTLLSVSDLNCISNQVSGIAKVNVIPLPNNGFNITGGLCTQDTVIVTYAGSFSPTATYTWNFDNPSYQQGSNSGPYKLVWNTTGVKNLSLQVSDLGCSSTLNTQTINLGTTPTAEIDGDTVICLNQYSVIKFKFSGALPFNYTYSDGTSTSTKSSFTVNDTAHFKPDSDGSYHINLLTVKDGNGCNATISGNADVLVRPIPFAVLSGGGVVCEGNTDTLKIDFGGVAAIWNYSYTDGNNIYNQSTTSSHVKIPVTPLSDLTYSLINVNNGICDGTVSGSAFFDFVPTPTSSFDVDDEVCLGQSTVITYTGNASPFANYSWDFDGGIAMGNQQGPFIVSWNTAGTKSIKLKVSEIGCESDEAIKNLIVNPLPSGFISGDTNICSGNPAFLKVTLMGNGPWNLVFTDGNNQDSVILDVTNARIMVNPLDTTTYSLITITDGKGCTGSVNGISTVNVRPTPTADFDINRSVCDGDTVFLKYTGNGSFAATLTWDFDGANIISNLNNREFTIKWSSTGTKLVQLNVEENFCTSNLSNEVVIHNLPTLTALSNLEVCFGDTVRIPLSFTGKAPYKVSYSINTIQQPMQQFLHAQDTLRLLILSNSTINFSSLTDSNTCLNTISQSVNVHVNPLPEIELISGDTVCEGNLANIQYSIIGNFAPWQVVLSDSTVHTLLNTTGSIHVLANDTTYYKVLNIVDAKGCKNRNYEDSVEVITKPIPGSDFNVSKTHVCLDDTIKISYTGQVSNFTQYNWDLNNLIVLSGLGTHELFAKSSTPGIKTIKLKVTDQGCESVETTKTVNVVDYPDATFTNSPIICLGDTALLTVQFRGSSPFNFTYFDGTTTYSDTANGFVKIVKVKPDATGFYILNKVSDAYCSALIGNFTQVIVNPLPIIEVNNLSNSYCISQPPVLLRANVPGTFSSNISNGFMDLGGGNALLEPAVVGLGKYEIKVIYTDNNGCSNNLTQIIDILDKPSAEFNFDNFYCADSDTIKITLLGNGQYGRYNIVPSGGLYYDTLNGNIIPNRSIPGKYIVTNIVELGLCPIEIHRDTVEIKPLLPKPLLSNWIDTLICRGTESKIYAISNKLNNVNYTWSVVGGSIQGRNVGDSINVLWDLNAIARLINIKSTDGFCSSDTTYTVSISNATINLLSVSDSIEDDNYVRIRYNVLNAFGIDSVLIFRRISLPVSHLSSWKMIAKKPLTVGLNIYYDGPLNTDLHAYEYRIAIVNRCGDTLFTDPHRVILTQVQGNEQEEWVNLSFSIYKGWTANVYEIYRQLDNDPEFKLYFKTYALNDTSLMFLNVTSDGFVQCYRVLAKWYETDINGIQILKDSSWSNISCVNFTNPIKIYNSFSPNGDGINEFFWIKNINLYPDNEVFIFNRWGARVYHKKQYNNEWDGGGLPDGTYFYVVRVMQDEYRGYVYIGR